MSGCGKCVACRMGVSRGGMLCEYGSATCFDKHVAERRARDLNVSLSDWALATMDDGITLVGPTRRACLHASGIATKYTRRMIGRHANICNYVSHGGTSVYVGAISSLIAEGFAFGRAVQVKR